MALFYTPEINPSVLVYELPEEESKHACRVLRMKENDKMELIDGQGFLYVATIIDANPKRCGVQITEVIKGKREAKIHLAIAPTKNIDRIEWLLEKGTEIGVTEFSLLLCANSERKVVKLERLEKILVSAMKQSKRLFLPKLNDLTSFQSFLQTHSKGYIAHCYESSKEQLSTLKYVENLPILIGPEGDFTEEEVLQATQMNYTPISLGDNRLRTETAGLVAVVEAKNNLVK